MKQKKFASTKTMNGIVSSQLIVDYLCHFLDPENSNCNEDHPAAVQIPPEEETQA